MLTFEYPFTLTPMEETGGFLVTFPDFPEIISEGESVFDALAQAEDALDEAVANRIAIQMDLQEPSAVTEGGYLAAVPAGTALKAVFYRAIRERALSKVELAALLGVDEKEVRRLMDPRHPSKLTRIEELLRRLGKRVAVELADSIEEDGAGVSTQRGRDVIWAAGPLAKVS